MNGTPFETLATIRVAVGYLGERDQHAWWQSAFFAAGSRSFLEPVFGRTHIVAQCAGVTRAAAVVHDERIGVGHVYHLFRLPDDLEQGIHRVLHDPDLGRTIAALVLNTDAARAYLRTEGGELASAGVGPTRIGDIRSLRDPHHWCAVVAQYGRAFDQGADVYPYFTDSAE